MKNISLTIFGAATLAGGMALSAAASATTILYSDRATFMGAIDNPVVDTFDHGYQQFNTALRMEALSAASINYFGTGFNADLNIVQRDGTLCWGCNSSGFIDLTSTTLGTSSGVYAFGADVPHNYLYNAFITLGDESHIAIDLIDGRSFFGVSSDRLIKSVEIAHQRGVRSTDGSFVIDNVTLGKAVPVPEPASLGLLALGLVGLGVSRRRAPCGRKRVCSSMRCVSGTNSG